MDKKVIALFCKSPRLFKVKTRLAKAITPESALSLYEALLEHQIKTIKDSKYEYCAFIESESENPNTEWFIKRKIPFVCCKGDSFGSQLQFVHDSLFKKGYSKIIICSSDSPSMTAENLSETFNLLNFSSAVIGPCFDGGWYLLGLNKSLPELFLNLEYGKSTAEENLEVALKLRDLTVKKIETLPDIDIIGDISDNIRFMNSHKAHFSKKIYDLLKVFASDKQL